MHTNKTVFLLKFTWITFKLASCLISGIFRGFFQSTVARVGDGKILMYTLFRVFMSQKSINYRPRQG